MNRCSGSSASPQRSIATRSAAAAAPPPEAALIEVRLDLFPGLDLEALVAACPIPVLATLRSTAEGGQGPTDGRERRRRLASAREAGALLIDVEWQRDRDTARALGLAPEQVVASWHDPSATPAELEEIAAGLLSQSNAAWVKVVPTADTVADLERVLALYSPDRFLSKAQRRRLLAFAMGPIGIPSRYLAPLLGAPLAFAAWSDAAAAAPGQVHVARMESAIGHLTAAPRTLYGVIGADVSASLSPTLHGAAFRTANRPECLIPVNVPDAEALGHFFASRGNTLFDRIGVPTGGWAVTSPYKIAAAQTATMVTPRVKRSGAANTLLLRAAGMVGENTDGDGVVGALTALGYSVSGTTALVQGSGGAARGAAVGLDLAGASVSIRSRDDDRARALAAEAGVDWVRNQDRIEIDILVNATPLGRCSGDPLPFRQSEVDVAGAVVDMVYAEHETELVTVATDAGATVVDGRTMLAFQGIAQHAAFTSAMPPREAMLEAVGRQDLFSQKT